MNNNQEIKLNQANMFMDFITEAYFEDNNRNISYYIAEVKKYCIDNGLIFMAFVEGMLDDQNTLEFQYQMEDYVTKILIHGEYIKSEWFKATVH